MARIDSLANFLEDVATKIRSKTGSQSTITPANYDTEIEKISGKIKGQLLVNDRQIQSMDYKAGTTSTITTFNGKNLDTSEMTRMQAMFKDNTSITTIDISDFDTSNVVSFRQMFMSCPLLETIIFGNNFDTSNGTDMMSMFSNCPSLTTINVNSFNTSNVTTFMSMFQSCNNLTTITFGNNFNFNSATNLKNMFYGSTKLDNNTLNAILYLCTTVGNSYTDTKTLAKLAINNTFDNFDNIPNLSNYQDFLDAGWTIS